MGPVSSGVKSRSEEFGESHSTTTSANPLALTILDWRLMGMYRSSLRVAFLASGEHHYSPGVKPFLGFSRAAQDSGTPSMLFGWNCGPDAKSSILQHLEPGRFVFAQTREEIRLQLREFKPDFFVTDDAAYRLALLKSCLKGTDCQTAAYMHVFSAIRTLRPSTLDRGAGGGLRLKFGLAHMLPFYPLTHSYRNMLNSLDALVANSAYSDLLANTLYGLRPHGVVYPPMDSEVFTPPTEPCPAKDGILVFVDGDLNRDTAEYSTVLNDLSSAGVTLHLVGEGRITLKVEQLVRDRHGSARIYRHVGITDEELATLYRSVSATYIPQEWEAFGNVGPESLMCGTPVVLDRPEPWTEISGPSPMIRILRPGDDVLLKLVSPFPGQPQEWVRLRSQISSATSYTSSFRRLIDLLSSVADTKK